MSEIRPDNLPEGLTYNEEIGLFARGIVARQAASHPVVKRPDRHFATCTLDHLADNSVLGMHLAQIAPGGTKCGHRHMDETMAYIVSGSGYTEYRQDDSKEMIRLDWQAGDIVVIPCNAWHEHFNTNDGPTRQLSFRNTRLINRLLINAGVVYLKKGATYAQASRFPNRFDDEPDYFSVRDQLPDGRIRANYIKQIVDEPLPAADDAYGSGVSLQEYLLAGQAALEVALVGIEQGGSVRPHRPLTEEGMYILSGEGTTEIWAEGGRSATVAWAAGDVVSPPLGIWRRHTATSDVRYLAVRDTTIPRALGVPDTTWFETAIPDRFPTLLEPRI